MRGGQVVWISPMIPNVPAMLQALLTKLPQTLVLLAWRWLAVVPASAPVTTQAPALVFWHVPILALVPASESAPVLATVVPAAVAVHKLARASAFHLAFVAILACAFASGSVLAHVPSWVLDVILALVRLTVLVPATAAVPARGLLAFVSWDLVQKPIPVKTRSARPLAPVLS